MVDPQLPRDLLYNRDHYWIKIEGDVACFGLTEYAQNELGDLVFFRLPEVGDKFHGSDEIGEVESVKTQTELYAPLAGEIVEVNDTLEDSPGIVNEDPYGEGWIARIRMTDASEVHELISAEDYGHIVEEGE